MKSPQILYHSIYKEVTSDEIVAIFLNKSEAESMLNFIKPVYPNALITEGVLQDEIT